MRLKDIFAISPFTQLVRPLRVELYAPHGAGCVATRLKGVITLLRLQRLALHHDGRIFQRVQLPFPG